MDRAEPLETPSRIAVSVKVQAAKPVTPGMQFGTLSNELSVLFQQSQLPPADA